jgi:hypothetical protein
METRLSGQVHHKNLAGSTAWGLSARGGERRWGLGQLMLALGLALLIGVCGIMYRVWAFRMYSSLPTGFDGPMLFRQKYLLEQHSFLLHPVTTYSYWSSVVNAELGSYLMELINALVLQLSQWTALQPRLIHQSILTSLLICLACALLRRGSSTRLAGLSIATVAALITLGTPVVINFLNGWNVAYAWAVLLAVTLVYVSDLNQTWKLGLTTAFAMIGPPLYHSFGFLLTVYVVVLWLATRLLKPGSSVVSPPTVLVYYLIYQVYVSTLFFGTLVRALKDVVTLDFLRREAPIIAVSKIQTGPIDLQQLHMVLYVMLAIPIAIALVRLIRYVLQMRRGVPATGENIADNQRYLVAIVSMSAAIVVYALLFGLKFSVEFLINRGASYMIVPAAIAVIDELRCRRRFYWYVYPLTIVAVAISVYSFGVQATTSHASTNLTLAEAQGYQWLHDRATPEDTIFTDFRLSGPFIADGYFRVIGLTGEGNEPTKQLLNDIYYASTSGSITAAIDRVRTYHEGRKAKYLFLSKLMVQDYPGLNGYSSRFEPVPASFFQVLDASAQWNIIYQNEHMLIYERK